MLTDLRSCGHAAHCSTRDASTRDVSFHAVHREAQPSLYRRRHRDRHGRFAPSRWRADRAHLRW